MTICFCFQAKCKPGQCSLTVTLCCYRGTGKAFSGWQCYFSRSWCGNL